MRSVPDIGYPGVTAYAELNTERLLALDRRSSYHMTWHFNYLEPRFARDGNIL